MKFSFQTVWIIFGVTLAHLFVISALSSAGRIREDLVSKVDPVPAVTAAKQAEPAVVESADTTEPGAPVEITPQVEVRAEAPEEKESLTVTREKLPDPTAEQALAPVESLVETATDKRSSVTADPPAISSPPRVVREIRDLKPLRRS